MEKNILAIELSDKGFTNLMLNDRTNWQVELRTLSCIDAVYSIYYCNKRFAVTFLSGHYQALVFHSYSNSSRQIIQKRIYKVRQVST